MQVIIHPSVITGTIQAAASKSSMQRACAAALLHEGKTIISNPGRSNDDLAALEIIQTLGAQIVSQTEEKIEILSSGVKPQGREINCGESGLSIRMFAPIAALSGQQIVLQGKGSLLNRPMHFFDEMFPELGIEVQSNNGMLPITIKGPMQAKNITIDGTLSSQYLTGLLFAFAKLVNHPVTITVKGLKSKPYIDLTLQVLRDFGYEVIHENYKKFTILPAVPLNNRVIHYTVEGDWSGAAFLLVAGAIAGNLTITGLDTSSTQADRSITKALILANANILIKENSISTAKAKLKAFQFDATDCPDLFPPLVALAAFCEGVSTIKGVSRLAYKESNRALTLKEEFGKLKVNIILEDDVMFIKGAAGVHGGLVHSNYDHRIAMACAIAALHAQGETIIEGAEAINKSYPDFYKHLKMIGANVSLPINN